MLRLKCQSGIHRRVNMTAGGVVLDRARNVHRWPRVSRAGCQSTSPLIAAANPVRPSECRARPSHLAAPSGPQSVPPQPHGQRQRLAHSIGAERLL